MAIESNHKDIRNLIMGDINPFHIPIYQRSYTWEPKKQVEKLFDDILDFGNEYKENERADYYLGNIIVKNQTRGLITERVVVDGQQRITTTILILCAVRDVCLNKIKTDDAKLIARNISKSLSDNDDKDNVKLKLNNMEHQLTLEVLLTGAISTATEDDIATNYWKAYKILYIRLTQMDEKAFFSFTKLLDRVKVVVISLDADQDANSVFESINSAGKPLSGSDLIKNFLFTFKNYDCSHEHEKILTTIYTKNFEHLFLEEPKMEVELANFFREFIAVKSGVLVNRNSKTIYYAFKDLTGEISSFGECKSIILELVKWGIIYQTIRFHKINGINHNYLEYMRMAFGTYASILMDIFNKFSKVDDGIIVVQNHYQLNYILKKLVAYDVSRFFAGLPIKEITRFIPTIPKKLKDRGINYDESYAKEFEKLVSYTTDSYKQPSLNTLKRAVKNIDLYNSNRKRLLRVLILLENIGKREMLSFEHDLKGCQIEHIIPQTLSEKWSHIPLELYEKYLHTLGNLSITFDNQALGNKGFKEKKSVLIEKSRISLNNLLREYDIFDVHAVEDRATKLLDIFTSEFEIESDPQEHQYIEKLTTSSENSNAIVLNNTVDKSTPRKKIVVGFPDGETIQNHNVASTMVEVIRKIGFNKVMSLGLKMYDLPLVSHTAINADKYGWSVAERDSINESEMYVLTHSNTKKKMGQLEEINHRLSLDLEIGFI